MVSLETVNSVSGGKSSAYMAKHYPAKHNLFALVRIESEKCRFPDEKIRLLVEDRIQKPFIGTAEDDTIIYTMLDLEQYLGQKIDWVSGITYDELIRTKGGWLPNKLRRYCTTWLKFDPQFYWCYDKFGDVPVEMRIGLRANELNRRERIEEKLNKDGFGEYKGSVEKNTRGQNKWSLFAWQKPSFPLMDNAVFKDTIVEYWQGKPVRFADYHNCVGCFHRNPLFLNKMFIQHPNKMEWFNKQEKLKKNKNTKPCWRNETTYDKIKHYQPQHELALEDFGSCDTGGCID